MMFDPTSEQVEAAAEAPKDLSIMNGWLVESVGEHTCGAGMDGYGHEPGCGYVPVLNLAELDGYPKQTAEAVERVSALHGMVLRGNSMLGEELKSWCKHCDTVYPCETMLALEIELDCECYGADGATDQKCNACAAHVQVDEAKLADALREVLAGQEAWHCTRVWEGWHYGSMSEDDFSPVAEDDEAIAEIVDAVTSALRGGAQ